MPSRSETRQKYLEHVQKMFELAGDKPDVAAAEAKTVLAVETGLAQASMDRTATPRSQDARPQDDGHGNRRRCSQLRPHRVLRQQRLAQVHHAERRQPRLLQAGQQSARQRLARRLEDLPALEDHQQLCPDADGSVRGGGLPVQRQVHVGTAGNGAALEALREGHRPEPGHGTGPALRGPDLRPRGQGAHAEDGEGHRERDAAGHRPVDLDVGHHQEAGLRKAEHHREQHRLSRPVARLQQRDHQVRRLLRQRRARAARSRSSASTTRSTSPPTARTGA